MENITNDKKTADAFADSWNNLPEGSVYSREQFIDWLLPITVDDIKGKKVLELGCGNASLLRYMADWQPEDIEGVDFGDSVISAEKNMAMSVSNNWHILKDDLVNYNKGGFDFVYWIGVLQHLKEAKRGLDSVIYNTKPGGRFDGWVYA